MAKHGRRGGADIRALLDHPVVDSDAHILEHAPVVRDFLRQVGGPTMVERFEAQFVRGSRSYQDIWWSRPSGTHSYDLATSMLPRLYRDRFDSFGIDFAVLYTSIGLSAMHVRDDELRCALHRACNMMYADIFAGTSDRLTPSAVIPCHTPEEAIAELEFAVGTLGFKAVTINSEIRRPVPEIAREAPHLAHLTTRTYGLGHDSLHDYDAFWQRCVELGVAPACHTKTAGGGSTRASATSFVFNHLGGFASGGEFGCRSLYLGGVPHRFPELRFQFLEGGSAWPCALYNDMCEHWEKRNVKALKRHLNPHTLDIDALADAFASHGDRHLTPARIRAHPHFAPSDVTWPEDRLDEFAACGIRRLSDIKDTFESNFFFGCEADDRMVPAALDRRLHHGEARMNAMFSSDLGHWDVVDMTQVLGEAYDGVERGVLGAADFRDFTFTHAARCLAGANPEFFRGTAVEADVARLLNDEHPMSHAAAE